MIGKKILLIDDDTDFLKLTRKIFEEKGASTITARDGLEGMGKLLTHQPDLILLDIMMPGINGFQICQRIRQFSKTPLIMLSALDQDQLMVQGLEAGADDFLSKPVNPDILIARARAVLRRNRHKSDQATEFNYEDDHMAIDLEKHRVLIRGKEIKITPVEFRLLAYLSSNANRVLTYEQILFRVWGNEHNGRDDYVHVYISNLRSKIEQEPRKPRYIVSIFGVGYVFQTQKFTGVVLNPKVDNHSTVREGSV